MSRPSKKHTRALAAMRVMLAAGWTEEAMLISHGASVLGDDDEAQKVARQVFDKHLRIMGAA